MYIDAISSQDLDAFDELDKEIVRWNGRSIVELPNKDVSAAQHSSVFLATKEFREMMASCSVRRKKGDEEVEIKVEVDTRKPKPAPQPPSKPKQSI